MENNKINHDTDCCPDCSHEAVKEAIFIVTNGWAIQKVVAVVEWSNTNEKTVVDLLHETQEIDFENRRIAANLAGSAFIYADFEELARTLIALGYIRIHESMDKFEILKKTPKYSGE